MWQSERSESCFCVGSVDVLWQYGIKVNGHRVEGVSVRSLRRAILRLYPVRVDALDAQRNRFYAKVVTVRANNQQRMQRYIDVGHRLCRNIVTLTGCDLCASSSHRTWLATVEVRQNAAQYRLVGHNQNIAVCQQRQHDVIDALQQIQIGFAMRIAVLEFVLVAPGELLRKTLLDLLVREALTNALEGKGVFLKNI